MNRSELTDAVYKACGSRDFVSRDAAERAVGCIFDILRKEITAGNKVVVSGFGTFLPAKRQERRYRLFGAEESVEVPGKLYIRFKPSVRFLEDVNQVKED